MAVIAWAFGLHGSEEGSLGMQGVSAATAIRTGCDVACAFGTGSVAVRARLIIGYWDGEMDSSNGIHEGNGLLDEDIVSFLRSSGAS